MLILRTEAECDVLNAYEWYEERSKNLGAVFISEVESLFGIIESSPDIFAINFKNVRRALCKRFPYSIYYFENRSNIIVIGILHQRMNPVIIQSRK